MVLLLFLPIVECVCAAPDEKQNDKQTNKYDNDPEGKAKKGPFESDFCGGRDN
jgi:hypothetical protein